jgi:trimeric autotransporter adhesin
MKIPPLSTNCVCLVASFLIGCLGLLPKVEAVSPAPDGGYPGGNTAEGQAALLSLTTGGFNTAVGFFSLRSNTNDSFNTAIGAGALLANNGDPSSGFGEQNTATGFGALLSNTTGFDNTATGALALFNNTTGFSNTANGQEALFSNTTGYTNTACGRAALMSNTDAPENTAVGTEALVSLTTGDGGNTAVGAFALFHSTTGNQNVAIGDNAMYWNVFGSRSTAVGVSALANATGGPYIAVGADAGSNQGSGTNDIYIGDSGFSGESNVIAIGATASSGTPYADCFIGGIFGNPNPGIPVYIDSFGHLSTTASSRRFKNEIKPMDKTSEAIFALKPVTFRYKKEFDPEGTTRFGLVAEDVEKVNPDLVARDGEGKVYTVRYEQVNAMLLNEFLKEHRKVEKLEATVAQQHKDFEAALADLKRQIQKVSAQVDASKPAPQVVNNP